MKFTWIGWTAIGATLATVILRLTASTGDIGSLSIRFGPIIVMILMVLVSLQTYRSIQDRGAAESRVWLFFILAAIFNFIAGVFEVSIAYLTLSDSAGLILNITSITFFLLAYICFIAGLGVANFQFRDLKHRIKPWIPFAIAVVGFVLTTIFLFPQLGDTEILWKFAYIIFVVFDFVIFGLALLIAISTWGGSLSSSYGTISEGCILLVIFHVIVVFMMAGNYGYNIDHIVRCIYIASMAMITVGGDVRYSIEKKLQL